MTVTQKLILYSYVGSQWAGVAHLVLAEKGFTLEEVEIREIDLLLGENFNFDYLKINPHGTVPALIVNSDKKPLIDTRDILEFLDQNRSSNGVKSLVPSDLEAKSLMYALIELVHSSDVDTNLILLQACDVAELEQRRGGPMADYIAMRQATLDSNCSAYPEHQFYATKADENRLLHNIYKSPPEEVQDAFFRSTQAGYQKFAAGMVILESSLQLPYAIGNGVSLADLHIVPWLSHALAAVGTAEIRDFSKLEAQLQKVVPNFEVGPKTREWWANIGKRDSFKHVFSKLH